MPIIKPISDLKNYNEVLQDITLETPVYLTQNGRSKYAILDIDYYEKLTSSLKLLSELAIGEKAGTEKGWMTIAEVEADLGID